VKAKVKEDGCKDGKFRIYKEGRKKKCRRQERKTGFELKWEKAKESSQKRSKSGLKSVRRETMQPQEGEIMGIW